MPYTQSHNDRGNSDELAAAGATRTCENSHESGWPRESDMISLRSRTPQDTGSEDIIERNKNLGI